MSAVGLVVMPALLAVTAEAAWVAVVAGLFQAFAARESMLGIPAMLLAALTGLVAARVLGRRLGRRWPWLAAELALAVAAAGWLAAPEVRSLLAARGPAALAESLVANPGGWFAGVAFVRGISHARATPDPGAIGGMLGAGVPGLALAAMVGGMAASPWRDRFLADAQAGVLVFLVAGILALALGRLLLVDARPGLDWRRNPAWVALLVALLLAVAAVAVSVSLVAGPAIVALLGAAIPLLLIVGILVGFDRSSLRVLAIAALVIGVLAVVLRALGARPSSSTQGAGSAISQLLNLEAPPPVVVGGLGLILLVVALVVVILVRLWMSRAEVPTEDALETRWIDHGEVTAVRGGGRPGRWRWLPRAAPADAVAAYRALLEDLDRRPGVRREPGETPAEHAGRLRRQGRGALSLDLLAADYGLVRFGGITLTATENRRAVRRARALRGSLAGGVTRPSDEPEGTRRI